MANNGNEIVHVCAACNNSTDKRSAMYLFYILPAGSTLADKAAWRPFQHKGEEKRIHGDCLEELRKKVEAQGLYMISWRSPELKAIHERQQAHRTAQQAQRAEEQRKREQKVAEKQQRIQTFDQTLAAILNGDPVSAPADEVVETKPVDATPTPPVATVVPKETPATPAQVASSQSGGLMGLFRKAVEG
jgi:hypothetical protein